MRLFRVAATTLTICAVVLAGSALLEAAGWIHRISEEGRGPGGLVRNRNLLAETLVALTPFVLVLRTSQWIRGAAIALVGAAIALSRCRSSWVGVVAAASFVVASQVGTGRATFIRATRRLAVPLGLGIVLASLLAGFVWTQPHPLLSSAARVFEYDRATGRGRLIQYQTTARMIRGNPWTGVGAGRWPVEYARYSQPRDPNLKPNGPQPINRVPNSDWLRLVAEHGIPAGVVALAVVLLVLLRGWRLIRRGDHERGGVILGSGGALAIIACLDSPLRQPINVVAAAVVTVLAIPDGVWSYARWRMPAAVRIAPAAAFFALMLWATWRNVDQFERARLHRDGGKRNLEAALERSPSDYPAAAKLALLAHARGDCEEATAYSDKTLSLFPGSRVAKRVLIDCAHDSQRRSDLRRERQAWLRELFASERPNLVSVAPDGRKLLFKEALETTARLRVTSLDGRRTIGQIVSPPQFLLTWAPDAGSLAFVVKPDPRTYSYEPRWWQLASAAPTVIDSPALENATHLMRWSADGAALAYFVYVSPQPGHGNHVRIAHPRNGTSQPLVSIDGVNDLSWAPAGDTLAVASSELRGRVLLVDVKGGASREVAVAVESETDVLHVCFEAGGATMIATTRGPRDEFFGMTRVALDGSGSSVLLNPAGDVRHPECLPDGSTAFILDKDGSEALAITTGRGDVQIVGEAVGRTQLQGHTGDWLVALHDAPDGAQRLFRQRPNGSSTTVYESERLISPEPPASRVSPLVLPGSTGGGVPTFIREAVRPRPGGCVVVQSAGDRYTLRAHETASIGEALAAEGCSMIDVNVRGIPGYGRSHANLVPLGASAEDLAAVARFVQNVWRVPRERVVAFGLSDGALTAAEATTTHPELFAGAVLVAMLTPPNTTATPALPARLRLRFLHPEHDNKISAVESRRVREITGGNGVANVESTWEELPGEGHVPTLPDSWARIAENVLEVVER